MPVYNGESFPEGTTREEAEAFLASEAQAAPSGGGGGDLAFNVGLGAAGVAGLGGAAYAAKKAPGLVKKVAGRFLAKQIPGVGMAMDVMEAARELGGPRAQAAAPMAPTPAPADVTAPAKGRVVLTEAQIARFPQLQNFDPGDTISDKALEKIKLAGMEPPRAKAGKGKAPKLGVIESPPRAMANEGAAARGMAAGTSEVPGGSRHDVQYFSKSRGQHVNIEDMNQKHIEQAYRSLAAKNPKPGSVARQQMDALLKESIFRMERTGIHIGQAEPQVGSRAMRGMLPGAAAILPFILQGATAGRDIDAAQEQYLRFLLEQEQSPSLRRARADVPQGI